MTHYLTFYYGIIFTQDLKKEALDMENHDKIEMNPFLP